MSVIVAKAAVVAGAACGLAASLLLPLALREPRPLEEALRMPVVTRETTVSVFPAPGRPESSSAPVERPPPPAARRPSRPRVRPARPIVRPNTVAPLVSRHRLPPVRPQTDERLLAELGPQRPDDRSSRPLLAE